MEIIFNSLGNDSWIFYATNPPRYNRPTQIDIGKANNYWRQAFCHELGHAYTCLNKTKRIRDETPLETMRTELLAWRCAKSFCKKKYWNETEALKCLNAYAEQFRLKIDMRKLKIIPLNTNKWLIDEFKSTKERIK